MINVSVGRKPCCWLLLLLVIGWSSGACRSIPPPQPLLLPTTAPTVILTPAVTASPRLLLPTATPAADTPSSSQPSLAISPDKLQFALETIATDLQKPVFVTHAQDGSNRLFIVEKAGVIRFLHDGALAPESFLDIEERVNSSANERGLLGLAFAPNYAQSGFFFVHYNDKNGDTVVARFQVSDTDPNRADAASEQIVLQVEQPAANHNGGMLAFGADGYLYIGLGDGGGAGDRYENGQNPTALLGKMLRIDVLSDLTRPYTIPLDNPWVAVDWAGVDVRDEIWAAGLRNPWRYSFDRLTGDLWIGDVGQGQWEEINFVPVSSRGGLNFGWPILEGANCYQESNCETPGLTMPVLEYRHSPHCSVTGGYVYRGARFPTLNGIYFYADYCSGVVWAAWPSDNDQWQSAEILDTDQFISSFGEDEAGELYITDLSGGTVSHLVTIQPSR